ncbi:AAA family ATPase-like protein, putative, partial [Bodo saltans]
IMVGIEATIQKCATVPPPLTCVTVTPVPGDVGLEASRLASQSVISSAQLEAVLRRQCQGHVAFLSMIVSVRIATQEFRLEVVSLAEKGNKTTRNGIFCPSTEVRVITNAKVENHSEADSASSSSCEAPPACVPEGCTTLITGDFGCGKSFRLREQCDTLKRTAGISNTLEISVASFLLKNCLGGVSNATALRELFREAQASSPCIVTIDDLHLLCPATPSPAQASAWTHTNAYASNS